jgi:hypothetical protein
LPMNRI